ncbi:hypothetical protein [Streptomyces sp. NPDC051561]|uniref:hypothetical protein n=1 Tax=Streptomyces sp. NPDC051561 TaxID=3365658 RepID=UPI00379AC3EF
MPARHTARSSTACALAAVPLLLLGAHAPVSAAADNAPPAMSISLTNGVETVGAGAEVAYTVTVQNQGAKNLSELRIEQELPAGSSHAAAGQRAKVAGGKAVWTTDVRAHGKAVLTSSAKVGTKGTGALRAASTVCAYLPKSQVPVVCSSDMDLLPTGAQAEGAAPLPGPRGVAAQSTLLGMDPSVAFGALAGVALLAGGGAWALRRRGRTGGGLL